MRLLAAGLDSAGLEVSCDGCFPPGAHIHQFQGLPDPRPGLQIASCPLCDLKVGKAQSREWISPKPGRTRGHRDQLEDISLGSQR